MINMHWYFMGWKIETIGLQFYNKVSIKEVIHRIIYYLLPYDLRT
jgi:hypothetical protein